jgi:transposase
MDTKGMVVTNERVDDIPLLLAHEQKMGIGELINNHCQMHGNWQGASPGAVTLSWLAYILSEGDHRLNQVEEWYAKRAKTIRHYIGEEMVPNDFRDDRLAIILKTLSDDETWSGIEGELTKRCIRVYDLTVEAIRLDTTTVSGHWVITEAGLFQYGHSKDHRPDLPQLKVMLASLDPLGMPLVTQVVSGNRADDPLYLPAIAAVQTTLAKKWLLYIGDAKMAAFATRATIHKQEGYYLCPLSEVQMPQAALLELLQPALDEVRAVELTPVKRIQADGQVVHIADLFERTVEQRATIDETIVTWIERQIFTRSDKYAQSQSKALLTQLYRTQEEILALNERKQGKPRLTTKAEYEAAVANIIEKRHGEGLLTIDYQTTIHPHHVRKYRNNPVRVEQTETTTVSADLNHEAVEQLLQTLGWRVYVTNAPKAQLSPEQAVVAYREQFTEERAFGRLKGKSLSLSPMYLEKDDHATGLVRLLSLGLRILSLLEYSVRSALALHDDTLTGLYPGNPQRTTNRPTAEKLLAAFKDIILTAIHHQDSVAYFLNPLSDLQSRILHLLSFDDSLYTDLACLISYIPPPYLHEP